MSTDKKNQSVISSDNMAAYKREMENIFELIANNKNRDVNPIVQGINSNKCFMTETITIGPNTTGKINKQVHEIGGKIKSLKFEPELFLGNIGPFIIIYNDDASNIRIYDRLSPLTVRNTDEKKDMNIHVIYDIVYPVMLKEQIENLNKSRKY